MLERTGHAEFLAWHWWGLGAVRSQLQGRDAEALALFERAIEQADAVGEPASAGAAHASRALTRCERGEAAAALADLGPVMERSIVAGAGLAIPWLQLATFIAQAASGDLELARASLADFVDTRASGGPYGTALALTVLGRVELSLGLVEKTAEHAQMAADIADGKLGNPLLGAHRASSAVGRSAGRWRSRRGRAACSRSAGLCRRASVPAPAGSRARSARRSGRSLRELRGGRPHPRRRRTRPGGDRPCSLDA